MTTTKRKGISLPAAAVLAGCAEQTLRGLVAVGVFTELERPLTKAKTRTYKKVYLDPEEILVFKESGLAGVAVYRKRRRAKAK